MALPGLQILAGSAPHQDKAQAPVIGPHHGPTCTPTEEPLMSSPSVSWHTPSPLTQWPSSTHLSSFAGSILPLWIPPQSLTWLLTLTSTLRAIRLCCHYVFELGSPSTAVVLESRGLSQSTLKLPGTQPTALSRHLWSAYRHTCLRVSPKWQRGRPKIPKIHTLFSNSPN